jgi:lipopolysaccharide export system protein LptC
VSAREARQVRGSFNRYELEGLQADLTMPDGGRLSILAPQGLLDREAATLQLTGGLSLYTDSGYELLAERATVHFEESRALAEGDIRGLGPFGDVTSDRLVITENGQRVRFVGNVRAALAAEGSDPALSPVPRPPLADEPATGDAAGATGDG